MMEELDKRVLREAVRGLKVGPPLSDWGGGLPHVRVYPVFPTRLEGGPPQILSLSDGGSGGALIEEVSCEDAVRVSNPFDVPIYGGESECIAGRSQNRALKHDVLVPPRNSRYVLVNCVEKGQPTRYGRTFSAEAFCPWSIRLDKMRQLARDGRINQGRVWDRVDDFLRRAEVSSSTSDLHAVYERRGRDISSALRCFPYLPGQTGIISTVGPNLFLDIFSDPEILEERFEAILSSALVEGVFGYSDKRVPVQIARRALDDLLERVNAGRGFRPRFSSPGDRNLVMWGSDCTASAFFVEDKLHHLAAHRIPNQRSLAGREEDRVLEEVRRRYLTENRGWLESMRSAYIPRHRSHHDFVSGLCEGAASRRVQARLLARVAGPLPGPLIGTEEADRVPSDAVAADVGALEAALAQRACRVRDEFSADLVRESAILDDLKARFGGR